MVYEQIQCIYKIGIYMSQEANILNPVASQIHHPPPHTQCVQSVLCDVNLLMCCDIIY